MTHSIDRRAFLERLSGAVAGVTLSGCGGGKQTATSTTTAAQASTPAASASPAVAPSPVAAAPVAPLTPAKVVFEGDSRSCLDTHWPVLVQPMLTGATFQVVATSGWQIPQMVQSFPQRLGAAYSASASSCVAVIFAGTNTDYGNPDDSNWAGKYGLLKQLVSAATAKGYKKIIVCTEICRADSSFENLLKPFSDAIRSGFAIGDLKVSAIIDFGADPHFDETVDATNQTYFGDGLHPTGAGQAVLAALAKPVLQRVINGPPLT